MTGLPDRWEHVTLSEVCTSFQYGWTSGTQAGSGLGLLRTTDLTHGPVNWQEVPACKEAPKDVSKYLVHPGDVFISRAGSVGVSVLVEDVPRDCVFASYLIRLRSTERLTSRYLKYFLLSPFYWEQVTEASAGIALQNINASKLKRMRLPLAPIAEQERIATILEEQFSRLDNALTSIRVVREKAESFRRSLLHAAFTGELTSGTSGWRQSPLESLLEVTIGGVWGSEPGSDELDVNVLRVTELKEHGRLDPTTAARRSVTSKQEASRSLQDGDIILEKSGGGPKSPVGRVGRITESMRGYLFSNFMQLLRPNSAIVNPDYLFYFLFYFQATGQTAPMQTATTNIRNIKMPEYLGLEVPLPPFTEQQHIVEILEEQFSRLDIAIGDINQLEASGVSLRRSLLHAAFSGELTATWRKSHV